MFTDAILITYSWAVPITDSVTHVVAIVSIDGE